MPTIDAPPKWLQEILSKHQPADDTLSVCTCSYEEIDALFRPKRIVEFSSSHQASKIHEALAEGIAKLFQSKGGV